MFRTPAKSIAAVLIASLVVLSVPGEAMAQSRAANRTGPASSPAKRLVWTLIGAGIGFGAGLFLGIRKFDDAINSDRKVWISAVTGAVAGGIAGGILSWDVKPGLVPTHATPFDAAAVLPRVTKQAPAHRLSNAQSDMQLRSRVGAANTRQFSLGAPVSRHTSKRNDPLWEGMAVGAAIGAGIGLIVVPEKECTPVNPECPKMLRIGVGIPAIALGAALGALADKVW